MYRVVAEAAVREGSRGTPWKFCLQASFSAHVKFMFEVLFIKVPSVVGKKGGRHLRNDTQGLCFDLHVRTHKNGRPSTLYTVLPAVKYNGKCL